MFIVVKYGEQKSAIFNPHCKTVSLLDEIRHKCQIGRTSERATDIDLADEQGHNKHLRENLHRHANEFLEDKETLVLLQVDSDGTEVRYTPLLDDPSIVSEDFIDMLYIRDPDGRARLDRRNGGGRYGKQSGGRRKSLFKASAAAR